MLNKATYIDLEGADLTGKSTLLKTTFKNSEYSKIMCFHDRGILTHYLYNTTFNRYKEDELIWYNELFDFIHSNGIIILHASEAELRKRFFSRSDDIFKINKILDVNKRYLEIYNNYLCLFPTIKIIEVDNKTPIEVYEEAKKLYIYMLDEKGSY